MIPYDMVSLNRAATVVVEENLFDDFREIQLFAMGILWTADIGSVGGVPPPADYFPSRVIRVGIPAGFQTTITPVAEPVDVDGKTVYMYHYEEQLDIIPED